MLERWRAEGLLPAAGAAAAVDGPTALGCAAGPASVLQPPPLPPPPPQGEALAWPPQPVSATPGNKRRHHDPGVAAPLPPLASSAKRQRQPRLARVDSGVLASVLHGGEVGGATPAKRQRLLNGRQQQQQASCGEEEGCESEGPRKRGSSDAGDRGGSSEERGEDQPSREPGGAGEDGGGEAAPDGGGSRCGRRQAQGAQPAGGGGGGTPSGRPSSWVRRATIEARMLAADPTTITLPARTRRASRDGGGEGGGDVEGADGEGAAAVAADAAAGAAARPASRRPSASGDPPKPTRASARHQQQQRRQ
jgi:hypothetical protein